jgi:hypothetical protein
VILDAPGNVTLWSTNTSRPTYAVVQLPAHGWAYWQARRYYAPLLAVVLGAD